MYFMKAYQRLLKRKINNDELVSEKKYIGPTATDLTLQCNTVMTCNAQHKVWEDSIWNCTLGIRKSWDGHAPAHTILQQQPGSEGSNSKDFGEHVIAQEEDGRKWGCQFRW